MQTIILSVDDIREIVLNVGLDRLMSEMIRRLATAFETYSTDRTVTPPRSGFHYIHPKLGLIEWMPVMERGNRVTIKTVGYHPKNPSTNALPTILSTVSAYNTHTGHLIGLVDATFLTALRTGAASAVASCALAASHSSTVGLIGAGAQAVTQLHALTQLFGIEQALIYDADPAVGDSFLERAAFLGVDLRQVAQEQLPYLVEQSDIICTATSVDIGCGPVFEDGRTKPWLHVNAVGADFPGKVEVPHSFLKRSFVCPDFLEQAIVEGECQQLAPEEIGASLVEVVKTPEQYHHIQQQTSVFDSTGWAVEDQVAMEMLLDYAAEFGLGTRMQIESTSSDPHNPYQFAMQHEYAMPLVA